MSKNYYEAPESVVSTEDTVERKPIEKTPVREERPVQNFKKAKRAKVILITRDGCIAQEPNGNNVSLYGKNYLTKSVGDEVEF